MANALENILGGEVFECYVAASGSDPGDLSTWTALGYLEKGYPKLTQSKLNRIATNRAAIIAGREYTVEAVTVETTTAQRQALEAFENTLVDVAIESASWRVVFSGMSIDVAPDYEYSRNQARKLKFRATREAKNLSAFMTETPLGGGEGPGGVYLPDEGSGDTLIFFDFGRMADEGVGDTDWFPDYPASLTLGTLNNAADSSEWAKGSRSNFIDGGDNGGPASGLTATGSGSGAGARVYNNANSNSVGPYTSPGTDAFYVELWLKDGERMSASQGSMYAGAPFTSSGGTKWYFGIDQDNKVNFHIHDGTTGATVSGATTLTTPFTGQIWAYYNPGVELLVGFNGAQDGSTTPSGSIGSVLGGAFFSTRLHLSGTNTPSNYTTDYNGIMNRLYILRINPSRVPADPVATIALNNYNALNGAF